MNANPSQVLVVTGAARGIGAATAALAASDGQQVVLVDRDADAVAETAARLTSLGAQCLAVAGDVSEEDEVRRAFEEGAAAFGPPNGLVTCAGIDRGGIVHELEPSAWDQVIAVNLRGTFLCCREALRSMLGGGGAIVCLSSPFAFVAAKAVAAYGASKAGVCALVRSLAVDYAEHGVRVNALLPGPTDTDLMWANVAPEEMVATRATVRREVPLGRLAQPEEIARAAMWLLSDSASFVTGAQLACDGGVLARASISV